MDGQDSSDVSTLSALILVARSHGIHLTLRQLAQEGQLPTLAVDTPQMLACAARAGLKGTALHLDWKKLAGAERLFPVIVTLANGTRMVARAIVDNDERAEIVLEDPQVGETGRLTLDRHRFEAAWTGETALIKRDYALRDEDQPFGLGLIAGLVLREKRIVRDVTVAAVVLSVLSLVPILFFRLMTDRVLTHHALNTFSVLCLAMLAMVGFEVVFTALRRHLVMHLTTRVDVKISTYLFDRILRLPVEFFERTPVGLIARDMNEVWRVRNFLTSQLFGTILDSISLLFLVPVMFAFSVPLTFIVLGCGLLIGVWIVATLPAFQRRSAAVVAAEGARGSFLVQTLQGIRTVKSLALEPRQRQEWNVLVARAARLRLREQTFGNLIQSAVLPLDRMMVSGTLAIGVWFAMTSDDPTTVASIFVFLLLSQRVASPLRQLAQLVEQYDQAYSAVEVVSRLLNQEPEAGRSGHGVRTPIDGHVAFQNVRFQYTGATAPALDGVSFEAARGTTLGVMGRSGSGKTTVTRLLQRLHANYDGLIKIDGIDLREYDLDHLRQHLGVVLQDNFLFSGTIRDNITAAKIDATFDEVVRAARLAGAEEFIDRLPRGYETYIYEGSSNLSGGQRQRLAIARALITDPKVLILDEATSALDPESEAIVNANLQKIAAGRTVIVISHRLSSLVPADAILVLDRGRVLDIGRHTDLLERCEIYGDLWNQQNGHLTTARPERRLKAIGGRSEGESHAA